MTSMVQRVLPLAPLERIMRNAGAERVSLEAVETLQQAVEDMARKLADESLRAAIHARRKTVTREDVLLASK